MIKAWCVGYINMNNGRLEHASVFSEPNPTCMVSKYYQVTLFESYGDTYANAHKNAVQHLEDPSWDWIGPLRNPGFRCERNAPGCDT